jgi:hypothetical protein
MMTHKDEYIRGSVDIAVLAIASTLEILLFLASWTKLFYFTLPVSAQYFTNSHILYNVPVLYWIWLCLPNVYYDPTIPVAVFISPLAIFALVVLFSGIWLKHQVMNLWAAMTAAKTQDRVARFTGRSSYQSQSIAFGSILNIGSGTVSLPQTMSSRRLHSTGRTNFAESPVGKIAILVIGQLLVLLISKIIFG